MIGDIKVAESAQRSNVGRPSSTRANVQEKPGANHAVSNVAHEQQKAEEGGKPDLLGSDSDAADKPGRWDQNHRAEPVPAPPNDSVTPDLLSDSDLIWTLISDDRLALAYHLSRAASVEAGQYRGAKCSRGRARGFASQAGVSSITLLFGMPLAGIHRVVEAITQAVESVPEAELIVLG